MDCRRFSSCFFFRDEKSYITIGPADGGYCGDRTVSRRQRAVDVDQLGRRPRQVAPCLVLFVDWRFVALLVDSEKNRMKKKNLVQIGLKRAPERAQIPTEIWL